jgi:ribosomal protein L37AE/L43A
MTDRYCESCEHYGVKARMDVEIWEEWDGENERWGYIYCCPVCGRKDR